jgi:hypothetical protein
MQFGRLRRFRVRVANFGALGLGELLAGLLRQSASESDYSCITAHRPLLFQIRGLAQSRGSYALEAERKMGQLLKLAKKNNGAKGIGRFAIPGLLWFTEAARERQWLSRPTAPSNWDIFFP